MGEAHCARRFESAPEAVEQIVYSGRAFENLQCAYEFAAAEAIESAVNNLAAHPLVGRRVEGDIRELIISFGATGYVALYRFVVQLDEVVVLAVRHQREIGHLP